MPFSHEKREARSRKNSPKSRVTCEVRLPTYKRPVLLRRALQSLIAQTVEDWRAFIMDDSPDREARAVVESLGDPRLVYCPSPGRRGAAGNLDCAFKTEAFEEAKYACVLEDDNWFLSNFLEENIQALETADVQIMLRNQKIREASRGTVSPKARTTRGHIFAEGIISPLQLRASIFFSEGISNGGLFWRTSAKSQLQVGAIVQTSSIQEYVRTLLVDEPIFFAAQPLAVFTEAQKCNSFREPMANRSINRARQSILRRLLLRHGTALIDEAKRLAKSKDQLRAVRLALFDVLMPHRVPVYEWDSQAAKQFLKGIAKTIAISDPLRSTWRHIDIN